MKSVNSIVSVLVLCLASGIAAGCGAGERWNVVLVTFDTTRADHIGCYGNDKVATPNVDALARHGVMFRQAVTPVPITAPSHSSILTGKFPLAHGVRDNGLFVLGERQTTLAEVLRENGYATAAAVGSFPLSARFGLDQGFDLYDDRFTAPYEDFRGRRVVPHSGLYFDERKASLVNEAVFGWLAEQRGPFFLWVHYFDPHLPADPPPPYDQLYVNDPYLGEIAYADESLGRLLAHLEELGRRDRTLVVFTADHGEGRGDHDELTHSTLAYEATLHVPLIFDLPGAARGRVVEPRVGTVDVLPTVLDVLGLAPPPGVQGRSLRPLLDGDGGSDEAWRRRPLYAETLSPRLLHGLGELRALYLGDDKYIFGPRPELYDLAADPREHDDLSGREPEVAAAMKQALEAFLAEHADADPDAVVEMDADTRRRLEALGYIHTSGGGEVTIVEELDGSGTPPQDRVGDINAVSTAKTMLYLNRPLAAKESALLLLGRDPDNPAYLNLLARAELLLGRTEPAIEVLQKLVRIDPGGAASDGALLQVVRTLALAGDHRRALELLEPAEAARPSAGGRWYLASLYGLLGRGEDEAAALDEALDLDPRLAPARVDRAVLLARGGDYEAAAEDFERALADLPYDPRAHYNYGAMRLEAGDAEAAAARFARAVELDGGYLKALYALIATELRRGRRDAAEEALAALVAAAPRSPEAAQARRLFAEGA
jgi:arylsulfatase A-like enzyme/Tfp pilus assembly protein PilF